MVLALLAGMLSLQAQEQGKTQALVDEKPVGQPHALVADKRSAKMTATERAEVLSALGQKGHVGAGGRGILERIGATDYAVVHVEFVSERARKTFSFPGATPFAQVGAFADMLISSEAAFDAVTLSPDVVWLERAAEITVPPPPLLVLGAPTRGIPERLAQGGAAGYTGKGVILAIIDTGIDFRNPDFILSGPGLPSSRRLYFWDTAIPHAYRPGGPGTYPPLSYPNRTPVGTLYEWEHLTADLRAAPLTRRIPATDEQGHGTAAAGIAAGNGSSSSGTQPGVAPDADIIAVSIGPNLETAFLLDAILEWLDGIARKKNKPLAVSCSFGTHAAGHDGTSIRERHISAIFAPNTPGRAILISAGNDRRVNVHAKFSVAGQFAPGTLAWEAERPAAIHLYFNMPKPEGFIPSDLYYDILRGTALREVSKVTFNPIAREWVMTIKVNAGTGGVIFYTASGAQIGADAYFLNPRVGQFRETVAFHGEQVEAPATAINAIAVGSYDWNDRFVGKTMQSCGAAIQIGSLSCYSSPGFSRQIPPFSTPGYVKPEIAAPGQVYEAPYAHLPDGQPVEPKDTKWDVDATGKLVLFNGTSAATPYTAGVVALMMQKKPNLTGGEIKRLFQRYATSDFSTYETPNPLWGYGKLDLEAVERILRNLR